MREKCKCERELEDTVMTESASKYVNQWPLPSHDCGIPESVWFMEISMLIICPSVGGDPGHLLCGDCDVLLSGSQMMMMITNRR